MCNKRDELRQINIHGTHQPSTNRAKTDGSSRKTPNDMSAETIHIIIEWMALMAMHVHVLHIKEGNKQGVPAKATNGD